MAKAEVGALYIEAGVERTTICEIVTAVLDEEVHFIERHIAGRRVGRVGGTFRAPREEFERTRVRATESMSYVPYP